MDLYKMQRINELASELRRHNFAESSQDAFQQAEGVIDENPKQQAAVEEKPAVQPNNDHLVEKKVELLVQMSTKKQAQEVEQLRSAVNTLMQEMESLKSELRKFGEQAPPKPKEKQEPLKTEPKESHPRQGNFSPDDVDIQKMFYFGTKN